MAIDPSPAALALEARSQVVRGVALMLGAALCLGLVPIMAKLAYQASAEPLSVIACRFTVAALILVPLIVVPLSRRNAANVSRDTRLRLLVLGGLGYGGTSVCYFLALDHASAGLVAVVFFTYPAIVVLATAIARERVTAVTLAAVGCAAAGAALAAGPERAASVAGIVLAGAAALAYAGFLLTTDRTVRSVDGLTVAAHVTAAAALLTLPAALLAGGLGDGDPVWLAWSAGTGVLTAAGILAIALGVRALGAARAAIVSSVEPAVTVAAAAAFLGESYTAARAAGALLVAVAAATSVWELVGTRARRGH